MNTSDSLVRTMLVFAKISVVSLLLFQVSSCDLEEIPPLQSVKSNFSFTLPDPNCTANCTVNFTNASENATAYDWDFGDETTHSTEEDPSHTYAQSGTYNVTLRTTHGAIEHDTTRVVAVGKQTLSAGFTFVVQDATCTSNCVVVFTNTSQIATSYEWNFGDGSSTSTETNPQHTFTNPGAYTVTLKATKGADSDTETKTVAVGPQTLTAGFTFALQDATCTGNCVVVFTNTSQVATSYEWNFGDGSSISTQKDPQHTFINTGTYSVTLTAKKGMDTDTETKPVAVNPPTLTVLKHTVNTANADAQRTRLDYPILNNNTSKIIVASAELGASNKRNASALGMYYFANKWHIFNQSISLMQVDEIFNVLVSDATDPNAFVHEVSMANLTFSSSISDLDHPSVNGKPNARIFVTAVWEKNSDFNNHPLGVVFFNNIWHVMNMDGADLPVGMKINVIVNTSNSSSFVYTTSATSISSDYSAMDHFVSNAKPNAKIFVTPYQGTSVSPVINPNIVGLWYSTSRTKWTVFNESGFSMQQDASFNILVAE